MNTLIIRPKGVTSAGQSQNAALIETSLEALKGSVERTRVFHARKFGTVILEDLWLHDLPLDITELVVEAAAGVSCPIVTRWSSLRGVD